MRKGFTLLELIVVIVILGILSTLGFTQYTKIVEKGRSSEARVVLGQLRAAQVAYNLEYGSYSSDIGNLAVDAPTTTCQATHYFKYESNTSFSRASRCVGAAGKQPGAAATYNIELTHAGVFGGTAGYY